jgi:hypothetical protein
LGRALRLGRRALNLLDLDATDDTLYGNREGRFYHGHYRDYCYLLLYVFCGEHLLCSRLPDGRGYSVIAGIQATPHN